MAELTEADLGIDGRAYLLRCLQQAPSLSRRLLQLPLATGRVFAPAPIQVPPRRVKSFDVGGVLTKSETSAWLTCHLRDRWLSERQGTFVLQDVWAKPSDPSVRRTTAKKFFDDLAVFYFLENLDCDRQGVEELLRAASSFLLIGVFSTYAIREGDLPADCKVSSAIIEALAAGTQEIFVTAYDQEGLVVWQHPRS